MALDEHLRHELEQAGRLADPSGVYEDLIQRREHRRLLRNVKTGLLAIGVVAGSAIGLIGLMRVFEDGTSGPAASGEGVILFSGRLQEDAPPQLLTVDVATGQLGVIPESPVGVAGSGAWSPDGAKIVFTRRDEPGIFVMNANGSAPRQLYDEYEEGMDPTWSPDGTRIAFTARAGGFGESVFIVDAEGVTTTWIARGSSPSWSPDGTEVVFTNPTGSLAIQKADPDAEPHILGARIAGYDPEWSPDGAAIVFVQDGSIFVAASDGAEVDRLPIEPGSYLDPTWSPDGSQIAYSVRSLAANCPEENCPDRYEIWVTDSDGTNARQVTDATSISSDGGASLDWYPVIGGTPVTLPAETAAPIPPSKDDEQLALGFPVCNVSSIEGAFAEAGVNSTMFVATRRGDTGGCPQPEAAFNVIALDADQDGAADTSYGPIECEFECRTFSAPDVDGDGTTELLVVQGGGVVVNAYLYDVVTTDGTPSITPVNVAAPGDPQGGFEPSTQAAFLVGGDAFSLYGLQCGDLPAPEGPGIVATSAESLPNDSPDAEWHAHQTTLVLRNDGMLHLVDVRDFTEPVTDQGPSFRSGETLCGSNLGP